MPSALRNAIGEATGPVAGNGVSILTVDLSINGGKFRVETGPRGLTFDLVGLGYDRAVLSGKILSAMFSVLYKEREIAALGNEQTSETK